MSNGSQREGKPVPLIDERPALLRPTLAARIGVNKALLLERIWYLQTTPGRGQIRSAGGRVFLLYPLALMRAEMPYLKGGTLHRLLTELVEGCSEHRPLMSKTTMVDTGFSVWYSVDRDAVERECSLFRQAQIADEDQRLRGARGDQIGHLRGDQNGQVGGDQIGHLDPRKRGGQVTKMVTSATILNACARQAEKELEQASKQEGAGGQAGSASPDEGGDETTTAVEALKPFGIEPANAVDLLKRHGVAPVVVMAANVQRLRDAGYRFEDIAGYAIAGIREGWHSLSDSEVTKRVAAQRGKSKGKGPANVPSAAHDAAERAQAARDRREVEAIDKMTQTQWDGLLMRIKAIWAEQTDKPFPRDDQSRSHPRVRAIARGILFPDSLKSTVSSVSPVSAKPAPAAAPPPSPRQVTRGELVFNTVAKGITR